MKLILQRFYPNSTQHATFNDFNEFTAVSKLFNPFMTSIFSPPVEIFLLWGDNFVRHRCPAAVESEQEGQ